jgi:3-oxoacyl-[acyl-carrier protein] reductase
LAVPVKRLEGRRILITGGSRGLGRAMAIAFAAEGARVAITFSKSVADAEETIALLKKAGAAEPLSFQGSVADGAHAAATVEAVAKAWDGLDVLVNNAGITQVLPIALLEEADWDRVMAVNVKGAYLFSRAALKPMIKARKGQILSIGSFGSDRVVEAPVHYATSKAALAGFTTSLAKEVGRYGISVNLLVPGLVDTGMGKRLPAHRLMDYREQAALHRLATPEEIAEQAVFLVSGANTFISGAKIVLDGGL